MGIEQTVGALLQISGFKAFQSVIGCRSVAHLVKGRNRCGIYVLRFADGWYYVGKSIDIVNRFAQHCVVHSDIVEMTYRPCVRRDLDELERELIRKVEHTGAHLRNRLGVTLPELASNFDAIMSRRDQDRWIQDIGYDDLDGPRIVDAELSARTESRLRLVRARDSIGDVLPSMGHVLLNVVPALFRSELSFWVLSVLPYGPKEELYLRLNVGFQSLFDVGYDMEYATHYIAWWIPREIAARMTGLRLSATRGTTIRRGKRIVGICTPSRLTYGGADQVYLRLFEPDDAISLLDEEEVLKAIRVFSLGLVRKGTCPMSRSHHPGAVDDAINAACEYYAADQTDV